MKKRFSKVLSVILSVLMLLTMASVAFAEDGMAGTGTKTDPFVVTTEAELTALASDPAAYDGKYIVLGNDIEITARSFTPIGTQSAPFKGIFDGSGYKIKKIAIANKENGGLFGYAVGAEIRNLTIVESKCTCTRNTNVGMVVGYAENTTVSNVQTTGCTVTGGAAVGGIAGNVKDCVISDCRVIKGANGAVTVNSGDNAGGIVGLAAGSSILRCINSAAVNGKGFKNCAGIAGSITGTVSHCLNNGAISNAIDEYDDTHYGVAGIAGAASGEISYCGNAGDVAAQSVCSGIADVADQLTVSFCYNAGTLTYDEDLDNAFNVIAPAAATVTNCVGVDGTVTADDLKSAAAFEGWDFASVWYEPADYHGYPYPTLRDCNFHTLSITESDPDCTTPGVRDVHCTDACTFEYQEQTAPKLGHDYSVVNSRKAATCTYEGEVTYECSRCHELNPEKTVLPIDPSAHVDADNDNICDLCEKTIKEEEEQKSFFQKIIDFFKRIFDWIRNLFTRK